MQKTSNALVLVSFRGGLKTEKQKTAECSHFSFQGANAPQRASYHYIQIRRVEAVGSLPALNLLAKSVFCALFVCACIWFIPSARVFVKSFRCLCFTESMFVFGISAVLIAGDANSDAFKACRLFFVVSPAPPPLSTVTPVVVGSALQMVIV